MHFAFTLETDVHPVRQRALATAGSMGRELGGHA